MNILETITLTNTQDNHNKIWSISRLENGDCETSYGKIGGPQATTLFPESGEDGMIKKINSKIRKGYVKDE